MKFAVIGHTIQMVFLAGGSLLLLLIVLSGSIDHFPINEFYWIQADTSGITNAPDYSRWTFWGLCSNRSRNNQCQDLAPLYPFSPVDNFGTTSNVPSSFVSDRNVYYYLTRCSWAFFLIALIFVGVSFISSLFACFWRSLRNVLTLFVSIGVLFTALAIACQTAAVVMGRNAFRDANMDVSIGVQLMACGWAAFVVALISWFGTCCACASHSYRKHRDYVNSEKAMMSGPQHVIHDDEDPYPLPVAAPTAAQPVPSAQQNLGTLASNEGGIRFFKIRRNNKGDEESE